MCGVHHRLWGKLCASVEVQAEESSKLGQGWCLCDRLLPYVSRRNTSHMVRTFTIKMLLLLLLSRFSRVRLCATPETAACQAPPSLGFSRQEHWSGLPFPSPMHESER